MERSVASLRALNTNNVDLIESNKIVETMRLLCKASLPVKSQYAKPTNSMFRTDSY